MSAIAVLMEMPHISKDNQHTNYLALQDYINESFEIIDSNRQSIIASKMSFTVKTKLGVFKAIVENGKIISYNKITEPKRQ